VKGVPTVDHLMSSDDRLRAMGSLRDLEPCPLCGGDPLSAAERNPETGKVVAKVFCSRCTLVLSRCLAPSQEAEARDAVKERWNLRPAPARPWTFCADALPTEAAQYEVAVLIASGHPLTVLERAWFWPPSEDGMKQGWSLSHVYAWLPIAGDPPPLRPEDRAYLRAAGVPAEWLREE
jgi:hypothetical protein